CGWPRLRRAPGRPVRRLDAQLRRLAAAARLPAGEAVKGRLRGTPAQGEEEAMKFFTRELYERAHADDDAVVCVAVEEWELAQARYEQHLQALAPELPAQLHAFNELLLHDAV